MLSEEIFALAAPPKFASPGLMIFWFDPQLDETMRPQHEAKKTKALGNFRITDQLNESLSMSDVNTFLLI